MGCCASLFSSTKPAVALQELPKTPKSKTPPTVLDDKFRGKFVQLNNAKMIATGSGLVLGKSALNTDKVYFEVTFTCTKRKQETKETKQDATKPLDTKKSSPTTLFQLGVAVKSNIKSRKILSGTGQSDTVQEDDKARWMWSWGPSTKSVLDDMEKEPKKEHTIGVAYDQSVGTGTIVVYYNGSFVAGPLPGGLRGIKGKQILL